MNRSAIMSLVLIYRDDQMFDVPRIYGTMSTNTMDARCQLIRDEKYCQLFDNKQLFVEAYPVKKKSDCHLGFDKFVKEYGAPVKMTYNGAQKKIGRKTEFQRVVRKYEIKGNVTETKRSNQNAVEVYI